MSEQRKVVFSQTQDKDRNLKRVKTARESHIYFTAENNTTGRKNDLNWKRNSTDNYILTLKLIKKIHMNMTKS